MWEKFGPSIRLDVFTGTICVGALIELVSAFVLPLSEMSMATGVTLFIPEKLMSNACGRDEALTILR